MAFDASHLTTPVLFLPALEFEDAKQGWGFLDKHFLLKSYLNGFGPIKAGGRLFIPFHAQPRPESTSAIILDDSLEKRWRHITYTLREDGVRLPEDSRLSCLLVEGKHSFRRAPKANGIHPMLWYRTVSGPRDAYAVWMDLNGVPLKPAFHVVHNDERRILRRIYSASAGICGIYAREPIVGNNGTITGDRETLIIIRFEIIAIKISADSERSDERLKIHMIRRSVQSTRRGRPWAKLVENLKNEEMRVAGAARDSFDHTCEDRPADFGERLEFMRRQISGLVKDRRLPERFRFETRAAITSSWRQALDLVTEAWQLAVVADLYGDEEFDIIPEGTGESLVRDPSSSRVYRMISQYPCDQPRRAELMSMADKYGLFTA